MALVVKNLPANAGHLRNWVRKILWRAWKYTTEFKNPMDRGARQATIHGITQSQTWLTWLKLTGEKEDCHGIHALVNSSRGADQKLVSVGLNLANCMRYTLQTCCECQIKEHYVDSNTVEMDTHRKPASSPEIIWEGLLILYVWSGERLTVLEGKPSCPRVWPYLCLWNAAGS